MNENILQVKMLGGFEMSYNNKAFSIERNKTTKVNQLLQLLLYYREGVMRVQLLEYLFDGEIVTNPSNSLRALVFRLRKILPENGLPHDDYVNISKGRYSWTGNITVSCDAHEFEELVVEVRTISDAQKKKAKLRKAFDLYQGVFLPMLTDVLWTREIDTKLKGLYSECVDQLCQIYLEDKDYEQLYYVSEKAAGLYPYNEWQYYQMQALIALKRDKEAIMLYQNTENMMYQDLGVSVSKEMTKMLDKLGAQVKNRTDLISTVKNNLDTLKEEESGAFFCSYPSFLETYRYIKRVITRNDRSAWLMLCTLTDGKGYALDAGNRQEELSSELAESIKKSCRSMDMYTKYSDNQFLILLLDIEKDDCTIVQNRINRNMCKESRKRYIQYHLAPINTVETEAGELTKIINTLEHK